jgi:hypothetical protein
MPPTTKEQVIPLVEITRSSALRVDRDAGVIHGVKVLGLVSANGRRYSRGAIEKARPLYEGTPVNIDHPHAAQPDERRRLADRLGRLENIRATDAGLFADLHYLKSHPLAEMTAEAAERMPETLGLSHNAVGRIVQRQQETIVEEIMQVRSVDVVSDPATTKSLFEERGQGSGVGDQGLGDQRSEVGSQISDLKSQIPNPQSDLLEELALLRRREEVRELLESAGVPAEAALVRAVALIESADAREALIAAWPRTARSTPRLQSQSPHTGRPEAYPTGGRQIDFNKPQEVAAFLRGL